MGFFSELKEDLSQAVNELMPEELAEQDMTEDVADLTAEQDRTEKGMAGEPEETLDDFPGDISLEEMLANIDAIQVPEDEEMDTSSGEEMDASLDAALVAALEAIPDENEESVSDTAEESWIYQEPAQEVEEATAVEEPEYEESEYKGADTIMDNYENRQPADETAVITAAMQIKGDITSKGSVDVVGTVEGNLDVWGKLNVTGHINGNSRAAEVYAEGAKVTGEIVSAGAVKIGSGSVIIGNITAKSAAIAGAVKGDIDVHGPVILDSSAIVMGNIKSKSVQINNGAVIEGMCSQCYADVSPLSFFDEYKAEFKNSKKNK